MRAKSRSRPRANHVSAWRRCRHCLGLLLIAVPTARGAITFSAISRSGTNVIVAGVGSTPGGTYYLVSSTGIYWGSAVGQRLNDQGIIASPKVTSQPATANGVDNSVFFK